MNERDLFLAALEIEDPAARKAHLETACGGNADLLARVEALLASHEGQSRFLNTPVVVQMADDAAPNPDPTVLLDEGSTEDESDLAATIPHNNPATPNDLGEEMADEIPLGYLEPSTRPDSLGRLAHYEILEVIGRGAFGTVLKAFDEKLQRVVAIKVLAPEMAATSPPRKRFLREARASAQIRHENVVSIYAVEDEPTPYLVMEYIPGQTLEQRLNEHGPLDLRDVLRLGKQIADALAAAHAQDLIHRDIKPGNILLETGVDDRVKITDFGLARTADDASMTQSGVIAGTPMYMAPEQAQGQKLDQRADLFSFGSVLYQMLSGRPPFRAPTTVAVLKRLTEDTPRPIQEIIPEVPDWMCEIVSYLHAKDPGERYGTAREVSELLEQCAADVREGRIPNIPAPELEGAETVLHKSVSPSPTDAKRSAKSPLSKIAAAALILLVGLTITEATGVTRFASTVIRVATGSGTLVIETDDPGVKIAIDGEEVTITGGGVEELTLRPGDYQIAAMKNGKQVKQELVTITRNGRTVVKLSLERGGTVGTSEYASNSAAQNHALSFDNFDELVELPLLANQLPQGPFTIEGYVTLGPGEWPEDERVNLFMDSSNILLQFQLFKSWRFWRATGKSGPGIIANEPPASGVRTHVAAVWDGSQQMLFVNGQRQAVSTNTVEGVALRKSFIPRIGGIGSAARIKELVSYAIDEFRISSIARYSGAFTPTARFEPDEHTLALYHFDEGRGDVLKDSSGHGHHGKIVGAKWVRVDEELNAFDSANSKTTALSFNGPGEFVKIPTFHYEGDAPLTIEAVLDSENDEPFSLFSSRPDSGVRCYFENGFWSFGIAKDGIYRSAGFLGQAKEARHVAGVWDGKNFTFYQNGKRLTPVLGGAIPTEYKERKSGLIIGAERDEDQFSKFFQGRIGAIRISNVVRYEKDFTPAKRFENDEHTLALYYFDEGEGDVLKDSSGHNHHGKIVRAKWVRVDDQLRVIEPDRRAAEYVVSVGGRFRTDLGENWTQVIPSQPFHMTGVGLERMPVSDAGLAALQGLTELQILNLSWTEASDDVLPHFANCQKLTELKLGPGVTDKGLAHFSHCENLTSLSLIARPMEITDASLAYFKNCRQLQSLLLHHTDVTGAGLAHLRECQKLKEVTLSWSGIADAGLAEVVNWTELASLTLDRMSISNAGLAHLKGCKNLKLLKLHQLPEVSQSMVDELKQALPQCEIVFKPNEPSTYGWPADAPPPAIAPFTAEQAKQHQAAWAKYLGVPVEIENSLGMKFRLIPPGEFLMGSTPEEIEAALKVAGEDQNWRERINSEAPQHKVILTHPLYVGLTELTQTQYEQVMGSNPSYFSATGDGKELVADLETGNHPVEMVSWNDAAEFCAKLSRQEKLKPFYIRSEETVTPQEGTGYRLPTEAEWEFACRAGTKTRFWSGDADNDLIPAGWVGSNSGGRTRALGELRSNPFGLFDVHGNVWEWVQDNWDPAFYARFKENPAVGSYNPFSAGNERVIRGGDWGVVPSDCRSSTRSAGDPTYRAHAIGFRVVLPVDSVKERLPGKPQARLSTQFQWPADAPPPAIAPFTAEQAKQHQQAWADYLGVPVEKRLLLGQAEDGKDVMLDLVLIPPGEFLMGTSDEQIAKFREQYRASALIQRDFKWLDLEGPQRSVCITRPFYMSRTEVSNDQFRCFVEATGFKTEAEASGKGSWTMKHGRMVLDPNTNWQTQHGTGRDAPVTHVTWNDANACCGWLPGNEGDLTFALPTEAQWEYACRAGTTTAWSCGDDEEALKEFAIVNTNWYRWCGTKKPNAFGLYDMHGNVWEWCRDSIANYRDAETVDPVGPDGEKRIIRGGNCFGGFDNGWHNSNGCRSAVRYESAADHRVLDKGFRVVAAISEDVIQAAIDRKKTTSEFQWPDDAPPMAIAPFDAEQAKAHQEVWAKYLGVPVEKEISLGQDKDGKDVTLTMVLIPPGEFMIGATDQEQVKWLSAAKAEHPNAKEDAFATISMEDQRFVRITKPFWLGKLEFKTGQFRRFVESTSYKTDAETNGEGAARPAAGKPFERLPELNWDNWGKISADAGPVVNVSWNDAAKCCEWLSSRHPDMTFSLPTEAQWEFACRAGTRNSLYDCETSDELRQYAQFGDEVRFIQRGGQLRPNAFGLYDMLGNVNEWCSNWLAGYATSPTDDPAGPAVPGKYVMRAVRGGSFMHSLWSVRSSKRDFYTPDNCFFDRGFRVAATISDDVIQAAIHSETNQ